MEDANKDGAYPGWAESNFFGLQSKSQGVKGKIFRCEIAAYQNGTF